VLSLLLGLIPGVGAVYNGQYAKGVAHVVIFGGLVSLLGAESSEGVRPLLAMMLLLMIAYMPLEAFRTARAIESGQPVDELSGLLPAGSKAGSSPALGIGLIALGIIILLHTLGYWRIAGLLPYWPVLLILMGIHLLYRRFTEDAADETSRAVASHSGLPAIRPLPSEPVQGPAAGPPPDQEPK
jgi:hypothetical protein